MRAVRGAGWGFGAVEAAALAGVGVVDVLVDDVDLVFELGDGVGAGEALVEGLVDGEADMGAGLLLLAPVEDEVLALKAGEVVAGDGLGSLGLEVGRLAVGKIDLADPVNGAPDGADHHGALVVVLLVGAFVPVDVVGLGHGCATSPPLPAEPDA